MKKCLLLLSLCFIFGPIFALAQADTSDFNIKVLVGDDLIPPTTPTILSGVAVAYSQVDITWSESTDNYRLDGYVVFRDGAPVATTTLLNYSDTGLSASSTYAYTVRAFDSRYNYSSSSNSFLVTTPAPPAPPPDPEPSPVSGDGTATRVVTEGLFVETGISTTTFTLEVARPARVELRWGRTGSYELGYVVRDAYTRDHSIFLRELEPSTRYEYQLIGFTPSGVSSVIKIGNFTTLGTVSDVAPPNVSQFVATIDDTTVLLTWGLPDVDDFSYVRIVRSHLGVPAYPQDGAVVYQGGGEQFADDEILSSYSPVYYTAFVYDNKGNVSSGAVALAFLDSAPWDQTDSSSGEGGSFLVEDLNNIDLLSPDTVSSTNTPTSTIYTDRVTVDMRIPTLEQINIFQGVNDYTMRDDPVVLDSLSPFKVSLPYSAVAGNLKTMIVTVVDPNDLTQSYSYLLRLNKDKSAYEAIIPAVLFDGRSQVSVSIYDYEALTVAKYEVPVSFVAEKAEEKVLFPDVFLANPLISLLVITIPLWFLLFLLFWQRRREN